MHSFYAKHVSLQVFFSPKCSLRRKAGVLLHVKPESGLLNTRISGIPQYISIYVCNSCQGRQRCQGRCRAQCGRAYP